MIFIFLFFLHTAEAAKFSFLGEKRWPSSEMISKTRFGGVSGLALFQEKIFMVSDDRGLVDEPRFFSFELKKNSEIDMKSAAVKILKFPKLAEVVDMESIRFLGSQLLISSEGDTNKKPRVPPRIFLADVTGGWLRDLRLPEKLMPEPTGLQLRGVRNNFSLESMDVAADGSKFWFTTESPLIQDKTEGDRKLRFRLFEMTKAEEDYKSTAEYYFEMPPEPVRAGVELVRGWSELLHRGDKKFWLLERSLYFMYETKLEFVCRVIGFDFSESSEVSGIEKLTEKPSMKAAKVEFVEELKVKGAPIGNCESLMEGPGQGQYSKTLWVATDNNFVKGTDTAIYFFGIEP